MDPIITTILFLLVGTLYLLLKKKKPKNYPPSPGYGLPIVGHMAKLGNSPFRTLMDWKPIYGPIVSVDFGSFPTVAISDYKLIKEALADWRFAGRPDLPLFVDRSGGVRHGLAISDGEEWAELRRFTMRHLREFGFGKKSMESVLHEEVSAIVERLQKAEGSPLIFRNYVNTAVLNSLWYMISSERFDHDDPELTQLLIFLSSNLSEINVLAAISFFVPWLGKYFPNISGYSHFLEYGPSLEKFLRHQLNLHRESIVHGHPRDLMDAYIQESNNCNNPKSYFYGDLAERVILTACMDLFIAGADTTITGLTWFGLYMAAYPELQEKLYQEILDVVGKSRLPSLEDKAKMPYTEAVLLEVLRISTLLPVGVFHSTLADAELGGYVIPKNTMIITNLYSCSHDPEYWGDPEVFRPERFLSPDGKTVIRHEPSIPFSIGKRNCIGENLAWADMFIFSTAIVQQFQFIFDPENVPASYEPNVSLALSPQPHKIIFTERQH